MSARRNAVAAAPDERRHALLMDFARLRPADEGLERLLEATAGRLNEALHRPEGAAARIVFRDAERRYEVGTNGLVGAAPTLRTRLELPYGAEAEVVLGYVEPPTEHEEPFDASDRATFEAAGALLASQLERYLRQRRAEALQRELELRSEVQRSLVEVYARSLSQDPADVPDTVLAAAIAAVPGARLGSVLTRTELGRYRFAAVHGYDRAALADLRLPSDVVLFGRDWGDGRAFVVRDVGGSNERALRARPEFSALTDVTREAGALESLVAPVVRDGELIAAITVENTDPDQAFDPQSGELLQLFAQSVGVLLQRTETETRADLMARAVEASSDGIAIVDVPTLPQAPTIRHTNRSFLELLGLEPQEIAGWSPERSLGPSLARHLAAIVRRVVKHGEPSRFEIPYRRPGGAEQRLDVSITRLERDPSSSRLLLAVRDVSARYRHLAELERLNADLRLRLEEARTLDGIDAAITGSTTTETTLTRVTAEIARRPGVAGVGLLVVEDERQLRCVAHQGATLRQPGSRTAGADDLAEQARHRRSHVVREAPAALLGRAGVHHAWPLLVRDEVMGVLEVLVAASFEPDDDWHRFMGVLASQCAIAVEQSAILERLSRTSRAYARLAEFSGQIEDVDDPDDLVDHGAETLLAEFGLQGAIEYRVDGDRFVVHRRWGHAPAALAEALAEQVGEAPGLIARAAATGEVAYIEDHPLRGRPEAELASLHAASLLVLPIFADEAVVSVIAMAAVGRTVLLRDDQITVARAFVRRLERALERVAYQRQIERTREDAFRTLGVALEYRDFETKGHTDRVVALSRRFGERLGLDEEQLEALAWGSYLHDLGKITVPDHVLLKPAGLARDEVALVERHPLTGYEMSLDLAFLPRETRDVIRSHHEHFDGGGYPEGLAGDDIPYLARVFALVDVYDALTSERPYKGAWSHEAAVAEIASQAGRQFDPQLTAALLDLLAESRGSGAAAAAG
jgi:PAS domain S-box-containing protein